MNIRTVAPYKHQGQNLHPKLVYKVPQAMGDFLVGNGLAASSSDDVDIDLSELPWDTSITMYQGGTVAPSPVVSAQS
jgi:hypothetical protein